MELRDGWGTGSQSLFCGVTASSNYRVGRTRTVQLQASGLTVGKMYFLRLYPTSGFRPDSQNDDYQDAFVLGVLGEQPALPVPANNTCAGAFRLPVALTPAVRVPTVATLKGAPDTTIYNCIYGASTGREVWYRFSAPGTQAEVYFHPQFDGGIEWTEACSSLATQSVCATTVRAGVTRLTLASLVNGRDYLLRVYAPAGTNFNPLTDSAFQLAVNGPPARPGNDDCAGAPLLPLTARGQVGLHGSLAGATTSGLAPATDCAWNGSSMATAPLPPAEARDVWYRFAATAAAHVLTLSAATDALMEVLGTSGGTLSCTPGVTLSRLGCTNALGIDAAVPSQRLPGRTRLTGLVVGQTYWVRVYAARLTAPIMPTGEPDFDLSLHEWVVPDNDEPANARRLSLSPSTEPCTTSVDFTLDGATPTLAPATATEPPARDVWFLFEAPAAIAPATTSSVVVRFNFSAPLVDGTLELRDSPGLGGQVLSGTGSGVGFRQIGENGVLNSCLVPGRTYYVRVSSQLPTPEPQSNFSICLAPWIVNDDPCGALPLTLNAAGQCSGTVRGTTFSASTSTYNYGLLLPVSNCGDSNSDPAPADVWYRVVPSGPAFTLRCDDLSLDLARLYQPTSAQDCAGAMRLVSCQSSQQQQASPRPLGQLLFDQLTPGQPCYLALSGVAPFVLTKNFTLCAQAALSLPTRPALARGALQAWPNPVPAGEILTLELSSMVPTGQVLQVEWINTLGQVLPGGGTGSSAKGRLQIATAGRAPGLYLLRVRPADGPALPPVRVVVE